MQHTSQAHNYTPYTNKPYILCRTTTSHNHCTNQVLFESHRAPRNVSVVSRSLRWWQNNITKFVYLVSSRRAHWFPGIGVLASEDDTGNVLMTVAQRRLGDTPAMERWSSLCAFDYIWHSFLIIMLFNWKSHQVYRFFVEIFVFFRLWNACHTDSVVAIC